MWVCMWFGFLLHNFHIFLITANAGGQASGWCIGGTTFPFELCGISSHGLEMWHYQSCVNWHFLSHLQHWAAPFAGPVFGWHEKKLPVLSNWQKWWVNAENSLMWLPNTELQPPEVQTVWGESWCLVDAAGWSLWSQRGLIWAPAALHLCTPAPWHRDGPFCPCRRLWTGRRWSIMSSGLLLRAVGKTVPLLWCPRSIRDTAQPFHSHPILLLPSRTEICSLLVPGAICPSVLPHSGVCPCITAQTPPSLSQPLRLRSSPSASPAIAQSFLAAAPQEVVPPPPFLNSLQTHCLVQIFLKCLSECLFWALQSSSWKGKRWDFLMANSHSVVETLRSVFFMSVTKHSSCFFVIALWLLWTHRMNDRICLLPI